MRTADTMVIDITRFGSETITVRVPKDSTLEEVLNEANVALSLSERAWVNGEEAKNEDVIEDGDSIQIIGSKEGGVK